MIDTYLLDIGDIEFDGLSAVSFVDEPAIESDFLYFNDMHSKKGCGFNKSICLANDNTDKHIVTGPALIPGKDIYRRKGDYEYNVKFTSNVIEKLRDLFLESQKQNNITIQHTFNAHNILLIETWLVRDSKIDTAVAMGFEDLPVGTLMLSYKVNNESVWESIKAGELRGFSIEATLTHTLLELSNIDTELSMMQEFKALEKAILNTNEIHPSIIEELDNLNKKMILK